MLITILGVIAGALLIGAVVYLGVRLTTVFLKNYRKKKNSKILAAQVGDLIKNAPTMSLDDLEEDEVIIAEYDVDEDDLVQEISVSRSGNTDEKVTNILEKNGGIVVFD